MKKMLSIILFVVFTIAQLGFAKPEKTDPIFCYPAVDGSLAYFTYENLENIVQEYTDHYSIDYNSGTKTREYPLNEAIKDFRLRIDESLKMASYRGSWIAIIELSPYGQPYFKVKVCDMKKIEEAYDLYFQDELSQGRSWRTGQPLAFF